MATHWSSQNVVAEHKDVPATAMAVDYTGSYAVLAGRRLLALVSLDDPVEVRRKSARGGHSNSSSKFDVKVLEWSPTRELQNYIALAAGNDCEVHTLDEGGRLVHKDLLHAHTRAISDLNWHSSEPHLLATASVESCLYLWDVREPRRPMSMLPATSGATQVKWNKKNSHLLASGHDRDLRIWDSRKPDQPMQYLAGHMAQVNSIDWSSHHEAQIVSASLDCCLRFFDITSPRRPHTVITTKHPVWRAKYTPFGRGVVSNLVPQLVRGNNSLLLWAQDQPHCPMHSFVGHTDAVINFDWRTNVSQNGECQLVSWGRDRSLRIWKLDMDMQSLCGEGFDEGSDLSLGGQEGDSVQLLASRDGSRNPSPGLLPVTSIKQEVPDDLEGSECGSSSTTTALGEGSAGAEGMLLTAVKTEPLIDQFLEPRLDAKANDAIGITRGAFGSTSALVTAAGSAGGEGAASALLNATKAPTLSSSVPHESSFGMPSSKEDVAPRRMLLKDELSALQSEPWCTSSSLSVDVTNREENSSRPTDSPDVFPMPNVPRGPVSCKASKTPSTPNSNGESLPWVGSIYTSANSNYESARMGQSSSLFNNSATVPMSPASAAVASILKSPYRVPSNNYFTEDELPFSSASSLVNSPFASSKENVCKTEEPMETNQCEFVTGVNTAMLSDEQPAENPLASPEELLLLPPGDGDGDEQTQGVSNGMRLITVSDETGGTKQFLVQNEDGTLETLHSEGENGLVTEVGSCGVNETQPIVVVKNGIVYGLVDDDDDDGDNENELQPNFILQEHELDLDVDKQSSVEMTEENFVDEYGEERSKICVKVTTGPVLVHDREREGENYELLCRLKGITLSSTPEEDNPDFPKKMTVHVDESCLDFGGSVFHSAEEGGKYDSAVEKPMPDVEIDRTLKKVLIPLGNCGFMRVYGRRTSVDEKIKEKFPVPNFDLCRALAPPLLKHLIMNVGINVLIFGTQFFMATVDLVMINNELKIDLGLSLPNQHISEMRELSYNFIEIIGWETPELYKSKMRTMAIIDKNPLNLHQCSTCKKSYKTTTTLVSHMAKCKNKVEDVGADPTDDEAAEDEEEETRLYNCRHCDLMCYSMAVLNQHIMEQHPQAIEEKIQIKVMVEDGIGVTRCFVCSAEHSTSKLPSHLIESHRIKLVKGDFLKCLKCDVVCNNTADMLKHIASHPAVELQKKPMIVISARKPLPEKPRETKPPVSSASKLRNKVRKRKEGCHRCGICGNLFASRRQMVQHLITHTNLRPYKCKVCTEGFPYRRTYIRHMNTFHAEFCSQSCQFCQLPFPTVSELKRHSCNAGQKGGFPCPYCDFETNMDIRLFVHIAAHGRSTRYFCVYCHSFHATVNKLRYHQRCSHEAEARRQEMNKKRIKKIESEIGKSEIDQPLKDEDIVVKTVGEEFVYTVDPRLGKPVTKDKSVQCYYCYITFSTKNAMRRHIQVQHPDKPLYKCTDCAIVFKNNAEYLSHRKRYHKPLPLVTEHTPMPEDSLLPDSDLVSIARKVKSCKQTLADLGTQMSELQSLSVDPIKCEICSQEFETESQLETHYDEQHSDNEQIASILAERQKNEKPHRKFIHLIFYVCDVDSNCSLRFDDKHLIDQHLINAHQVTENFESMYKEEIIAAPNRLGRKPKNYINLSAIEAERQFHLKLANKKLGRTKRTIKCDKCRGNFPNATSLRQHKLGISGQSCVGEGVPETSDLAADSSSDAHPSISLACADENDKHTQVSEAEYRELFIGADEMPPNEPDNFEDVVIKEEPVSNDIVMNDTDEALMHDAEAQDIKEEIELNENCDIVSTIVKVGEGSIPPPIASEFSENMSSSNGPFQSNEPVEDVAPGEIVAKKKGKSTNAKSVVQRKRNGKKQSKETFGGRNCSESTASDLKNAETVDNSSTTEILKEFSSSSQNLSSVGGVDAAVKVSEVSEAGPKTARSKKPPRTKMKPNPPGRKRKIDENADDPEWNPKAKKKRRAFQCSDCSDKFYTKAELNVHARYDH